MANDGRVVEFRVTESAGRLDRQLAAHLPDLSRVAVQRLIKEGRVLVNGQPAKPSYTPAAGDLLRVDLPPETPTTLLAQEIPLSILYEDAHLLVIDKPAGLVVHPGAGHAGGTIVNALLAHRPDVVNADLDPSRPGIVHRLDRDTSGLLLVATSRDVQAALQGQFKSREVEKTYLALLYGQLTPAEAVIEAPLGRHPVHRTRMAIITEGGRHALTRYRVREYLPDSTLVEADLLTGRTHQLRVHFASIGHPVVGDRTYGFRRQAMRVPRQLLHAWRLVFAHPVTGERMDLTAPVPADLQAVLDTLRHDTGRPGTT
jgi:23S rRNA pseudouridine1911/1915/1917 synthase